MANKESTARTFIVAILLCLVCGIFVAAAAVVLKPLQETNAQENLQRNVLLAADAYDDSKTVAEQWGSVEERFVDINEGIFTEAPVGYDLNKVLKDNEQSVVIERADDAAGIGRRENLTRVYIFSDENGDISRIVLPVRGKGLWSTMWGFLALENDFNTIAGFTFYEHGETPGLGGEVDNPRWKAQWPGKTLYNSDNELQLSVTKAGQAGEGQIDGLSGATLTTNGIDGTIEYWLGENGYFAFLQNLKAGDA